MLDLTLLEDFCYNYCGLVSSVKLTKTWNDSVVKVVCYNVMGDIVSSEVVLTIEPYWSLNNLIPASKQAHVDSVLARTKQTLEDLETV